MRKVRQAHHRTNLSFFNKLGLGSWTLIAKLKGTCTSLMTKNREVKKRKANECSPFV